MKGDFSRMTFDPGKHFRRVLLQQGRVQLDADWNEQVSILLHYVQTLAADLFGSGAGPVDHCGFQVRNPDPVSTRDFVIGRGRYYVHGILCENEAEVSYMNQPDLPKPPELTSGDHLVVFLDVWERHISALEDDSIREVALGGPDTAARARVVWQVRTARVGANDDPEAAIDALEAAKRGQLKVRPVGPTVAQSDTDPCIVPPDSSYRGPENQLYRVEIHTGSGDEGQKPTFKWSRDNGSAALSVIGIAPSGSDGLLIVSLADLGRDERLWLAEEEWVEIVDDDSVLENRADPLLQVVAIDRDAVAVTLRGKKTVSGSLDKHPLLRRWDQHPVESPPPTSGQLELATDNAALIPTNLDTWLPLEDGVEIAFNWDGKQPQYRTGDYWLIPLRTATGLAEWPDGPKGPDGIVHHYAPLATITVGDSAEPQDLRCQFAPLPCEYGYHLVDEGIGTDLL
jgi:hypothetical protein